ncbi:hypothetical protein MY04_05955 (plasmid) [Flammeovirga sp. MY04]|uniref:phospholipase D family protein n=1 Tax=Flammeovirga sp. MY04 TaxID=1191459 RepID=UPI0008063D7D|nr:phospholipase D family protein [Flammeovirga sp. MY04]ANQ52924.1 hypothetical protein MY04_05955 [Flammeovirga sp. MY04]
MKVIGTTEISFEIENILNKANKQLILVTPYIKLNPRLQARLSEAFSKVENIYIFHRQNELLAASKEWLSSFSNVRLFPIRNLHAKIYANDSHLIICSMNLYEYSQINNHEIGVILEKTKDKEAFEDALNEVSLILKTEFPDQSL